MQSSSHSKHGAPSPSRERWEAETMLNQLMKRVEVARRARTAELESSRCDHDDAVRRRREEVLHDSKAANLLRSMRDAADAEERKARREAEERRKAQMRDAMYHDFEVKRQSIYGTRSGWKSSAAEERHLRDQLTELKRQTVKELRNESQRKRWEAQEKRRLELEEAHASRTREKKENEKYMTSRSEDRQKHVQAVIQSMQQMTQSKQEAFDAVFERNRAARRDVIALNESLRRQELREMADQMDRLQRELARLS